MLPCFGTEIFFPQTFSPVASLDITLAIGFGLSAVAPSVAKRDDLIDRHGE